MIKLFYSLVSQKSPLTTPIDLPRQRFAIAQTSLPIAKRCLEQVEHWAGASLLRFF
jgi:hypothetical protein